MQAGSKMTFPTTRLSLVLAAASDSDDRSREALAALCRLYWQPLHAYIRRHGYSADEAEDLTQAFMTRLIEKRTFRSFAQERGRFRSFLLASLKHFLFNERDAAAALKRGGAARFEPLRLEARPMRAASRRSSLVTRRHPNGRSKSSGRWRC